MSSLSPQQAPAFGAPRAAYAVTAGVAWLGVVLTVVISALGGYSDVVVEPHLYGGHAAGLAGAVPRVVDTFSYFTIWSNIVVAIAFTLLARKPDRATPLRRVLLLDALLMITITAIVYAVLLAPITEVVGWSKLTDPILHKVTPAVAVLVWLVFGPRSWIDRRTVLSSMAIPLTWIIWMLGRGAVIDAYPYGFANVSTLGYGQVLATLAVILVFGLVVASAYWGIDRLLARRRVSRATKSVP
jgi:hypothetical protein